MNNYAVAGVLGGTGYTGRELLRLLAGHPGVRVGWATSRSEAGGELRVPSAGTVSLLEADAVDLGSADVVFSCLPHGESLPWVARARAAGARVVDLSADLRVPGGDVPEWAAAAVYGFPEGDREALYGATLVANPGCYPTAVLTGLLPAVRRGLVAGPVVVNAASGVTGAGRSPKRALLFGEVAEDFRAYGVGNTHRHVEEMRYHTARLGAPEPARVAADGAAAGGVAAADSDPTAGGRSPEIVFTPHLLPVKRGILATLHVPVSEALAEPWRIWATDYRGEPFIEVLGDGVPALSMAVGTNRLIVGVVPVRTRTPAVQVVVAVDNLLKGAAGQAVQNMNLALGLDETAGLPC